MKHPWLVLLLTVLTVNLVSSQDILWEKSYGGKQADYLTDSIPTADYGFILGGSSLTPNRDNPLSKGNYDYCIWKVKENGDIEWQKSYGGSDNDMLYSIKATNDGGFLLAGISNSSIGGQKKDNRIGQNDIWILKLDARGTEMWQKTLGGLSEEQLATIIITKDNGFLIGASSESDVCNYKTSETNKNTIYKNADSNGSLDYWLVKLNYKGELEWQKTIGGTYLDQLRSVVTTFDGGFFVGGVSNSDSNTFKSKDCNGQTDFWYMKLNSKGEILWETTYGGAGDENLYTVLETKEHQLLVAGNSNSLSLPNGTTTEGSDYLVMKLDTDGTLLWEKTFSNSDQDVLTNVVQNEDGSLLLCGYSPLVPKATSKVGRKKAEEGIEDYLVLKTDKNGEELWRKTVGSDATDVLVKAIETRDGGYLLAGTSSQFSSSGGEKGTRDKKVSYGGTDFWVVKLKDKSKPERVKQTIEALPNPTIGFTNVIVGYDYEKGTATLVDLAGRQLQQFEITGRTVPVDLSQYPEGIYIINITTNVQSNGVKIIKGISKN